MAACGCTGLLEDGSSMKAAVVFTDLLIKAMYNNPMMTTQQTTMNNRPLKINKTYNRINS